uniref:Uncharacterized protein n=1 Tax=Magallana gigas TaxID=29159 RepID=A0A8W8M3U1_MAGGI
CYPKRDCCTSGNEMETRSVAHDPINGGSERSKAETCDGKSLSSCNCLQDGFRAFKVWIYCDFCGFKLINLELPQCCSCKRYNKCNK